MRQVAKGAAGCFTGGLSPTPAPSREASLASDSSPPRQFARKRLVYAALGVLLASLCVGGAWGGRQLWARHHDQEGRHALARQNFAAAREHFAACIRVWPDDAELHLLAAQATRRNDDLDEAERHLQEYQRLHGVGGAHALEGTLLRVQRGDIAGVQNSLRAAFEGHSDQAALILEALAKGFHKAGRLPNAVSCLDSLLQREANHFQGRLLRGQFREEMGRPDDALGDYEWAVALNPESASARLRLADLLAQLGRPREAVYHYEILRQREPRNPDVLLGLARCRHDAAELAEAAQLLETLLADNPQHVAALVERGRVAMRLGHTDDAAAFLERATAQAPGDRDAQFVLHLVRFDQWRFDEARQCLERVSRIDADHRRLHELTEKVSAAPKEPGPRCELGVLLLRLGREEQGVRQLVAALESDPRYGPAHAALADYFERSGQRDQAARHRRAASAAGYQLDTEPARP